jgi:hypothetical protein
MSKGTTKQTPQKIQMTLLVRFIHSRYTLHNIEINVRGSFWELLCPQILTEAMETHYELLGTGSRFKARTALVRSVNHNTRMVPGSGAMVFNYLSEHVSLPAIFRFQ